MGWRTSMPISSASARPNRSSGRDQKRRMYRSSTTSSRRSWASSMRVTSLFDVARRAEPGKDLHAEPVRGLDRGGVEVGDGLGKPVAAEGYLLGRTLGQEAGRRRRLVGLEATERCRQRLGGAEEPVPNRPVTRPWPCG